MSQRPAARAVFVKSADPMMARVICGAGIETIIVDLEHSSLGPREAEAVRSALIGRVRVLARITCEQLPLCGALLDAGYDGLQLTGVSEAQHIGAALRAMRFPPVGNRGASTATAAAGYGARSLAELVSDSPSLVVQVESRGAIDVLDELLACPGVDEWFLGLADLSVDCGVPGALEDARVERLAREAAERIRTAGQRFGVFAPTEELARRWQDWGASSIAIGSDVSLLRGAVARWSHANPA